MQTYYGEDGYAFDGARTLALIDDFVRQPALGALWAAVDGTRVVGYLVVTLGFSFEYGGRDAFVDELYIAEDARGQGLGSAAMDIAEAYCAALGVRAMHLEVEPHRTPALEMYRRRGFEAHGRPLMTKRVDAS